MQKKRTKFTTFYWPQPDGILLFLVGFLVLFGTTMVASSSVIHSVVRFDGPYHIFFRSLTNGVIPGLVLCAALTFTPLKWIQKTAWVGYTIVLTLLILVLLPGFGGETQGASRWLTLGSLSFQPSEVAKIALLISLCSYLAQKQTANMQKILHGIFPTIAIAIPPIVLVLIQPDFGTTVVLAATVFLLLFFAGARLLHLFILGTLGIFALTAILLLASYRQDRLQSFFDHHTGAKSSYQLQQAHIALGNGGFFGLGLGKSRQKFNYLPEPFGDSIFAIIGEELGLVGVATLVTLLCALVWRLLILSLRTECRFSALFLAGVSVWIATQSLINTMGIVGLIPLKGIPLPLISYGSTSLVALLCALGIALNISANIPKMQKIKKHVNEY